MPDRIPTQVIVMKRADRLALERRISRETLSISDRLDRAETRLALAVATAAISLAVAMAALAAAS